MRIFCHHVKHVLTRISFRVRLPTAILSILYHTQYFLKFYYISEKNLEGINAIYLIFFMFFVDSVNWQRLGGCDAYITCPFGVHRYW